MHADPPPDDPGSPAPPPQPTHRRPRLAVLSAAVLLVHAAAVSGLAWTWPAQDAAPQARAMQVRVVEEAASPEPVPTIPATAAAPMPVPRSKPTARAASVERAVAPAPDVVVALNTTDEAAAPPVTAPDGGASAGDVAARPIPHYRTQLPPAITLQYELQRGMLRGNGELAWKPQGAQYELKLTGRVGGLAALTQISSGGFDKEGVAPLRFTDQRLTRAPMAANFQREAGKITFSGPATEYALVAGSQDRLSWMVQLAAIVAAEPSLRTPGATVSMFVVGSRGEGGVWAFRCIGQEAVDTPGGSVQALKFMREPRDDHDTNVQVWLDSRRHWLPVRARQQSGSGDDAFELRLQGPATP